MGKNAARTILDAAARLSIVVPGGHGDGGDGDGVKVKLADDGTYHLHHCRTGQARSLPRTETAVLSIVELAALERMLRRCECLNGRHAVRYILQAAGAETWIGGVLDAEATLCDTERLAARRAAPITRLRRARLGAGEELAALHQHLRARQGVYPGAVAAINQLIVRYENVIPTLERDHDPDAVAELERNVRADANVSADVACDETLLLVRVTGRRGPASLLGAAIEAWMIAGDEHQAVAAVPAWAAAWVQEKCVGAELICQFASLEGVSDAVASTAANLAIGDSFNELGDALEAAVLLDRDA